ncbi:MAG: ATP-binding cassette domain-containing protein, partial [Caulobacteraceae bacterium]
TVASVVGPNGSGKSTLMKALTGVIRLSSGRVLVWFWLAKVLEREA